NRMDELQQLGVEEPLAARLITLRFLPELLDIVRIAGEASTDVVQTGRAYYLVAEHLQVPWLQHSIRSAVHEPFWEKRLAQSLLADAGRAHQALARRLLGCTEHQGDMARCIEDCGAHHGREGVQYREIVEELREAEPVPLAGYAVAVRALAEYATA